MNFEGRILPRRQTKLCAKFQRKLSHTIRRAKHLGLFSYKHGRFEVTDPFEESLTYEQMIDEQVKHMWMKNYPGQEVPTFAKNPRRNRFEGPRAQLERE
jgi:hypothetical protein